MPCIHINNGTTIVKNCTCADKSFPLVGTFVDCLNTANSTIKRVQISAFEDICKATLKDDEEFLTKLQTLNVEAAHSASNKVVAGSAGLVTLLIALTMI